jgi:hypothetical protein
MIVFAREALGECLAEAQPLLERHWKEIARNRDWIALAPDYEAYEAAERDGRLFIATARSNRRLVGYACAFHGPHPHYRFNRWAWSDVFWTDPDIRGPRVAVRLFMFYDAGLKAEGVDVSHITIKNKHPAVARVLERLGYVAIETGFSKNLR